MKSETNWRSSDSYSTSKRQERRGKLHVAFLIDSMHGGGAEISVLTVIESLLRRNHKVDLVLLNFRGKRLSLIPDGTNLFVLDRHIRRAQQDNSCSIPNNEIHWIRAPTGLINSMKFIFDCFRLMKIEGLPVRKRYFHPIHCMSEYLLSQKPDLVVANLNHSYHVSILGRMISSANVPIIWSIHNDDLAFLSKKNQTYFSQLIRNVDRIHTVSCELANSVTKYLDSHNLLTEHQEVVAIFNGFNFDRISSLSSLSVEHDWFASDGNRLSSGHTKKILAVGRLCDQKNYELLINAFSMVLEQVDARLLILGEGERRCQLENIVDELNIAHAVSMPGWVDNPYPYMAQADVFVLSSDYEGMPMVLGEALICGCAVVSTDCPTGPREILEDGRWGYLTQVNNQETLVAAILESLSDDVDHSTLKARGSDFDINFLVEEYENFYHEVIVEFKTELPR